MSMITTLADAPIGAEAMSTIARDEGWHHRATAGGSRAWVNPSTGDVVVQQATPEGVPEGYNYVPPDKSPPEDAEVVESPHGGTYTNAKIQDFVEGSTADDGSADADAGADADADESDEVSIEEPTAETVADVPDAEPSDLAGGIAAAIDDTRDDFHDIRNAVTGADSREEAVELLESELSEEEIADAVAEVDRQQQMREQFDVIDDPSELRFGQEILYDADRPKRGVVDDIDADGTVWIEDAGRDMNSGVNPEYGTVYADPSYDGVGDDDEEPFTAEPGRNGLASNPEVLENSFEAAAEVKGAREAGIRGGNTTGDQMKILEMDDGSRVFATPVDAYPGSTGVVDSQAEARENNLRSPQVIEALGGSACKTRIAEGPSGREFIAKEGIDGETVSEFAQRGGRPGPIRESAEKTMAASYFVGNMDLHGGNMAVSDDGEYTIIDHDSAGYNYDRYRGVRTTPDVSRYDSPKGVRGADVRDRIYDLAEEIRSGERDLGVPDTSAHAEFAEDAAEKAMRVAYVDPTRDVPDDQVPADLQFPPSGYESVEDFEGIADDGPQPVTFVDGSGNIVDGEIQGVSPDGEIQVQPTEHGGFNMFEDPNRIVEVL